MTRQRLPAPLGTLINRNKPITISFEGESYKGYEGDSIASALLANDQWILSRSFKYHRPRGPLTLAGQDANTLIQKGGEPNILADRTPAGNGDKTHGQNYSGSLENDRDAYLGKLSQFMPVGFYYRAFYKPFGAWMQWEKLIRAKAGLGVLDLDAKPEYYDKQYLFYDAVIIGSGPAGLAAAITLAESGASVLIVEEHSVLGGSLTYHRFDTTGQKGERLHSELIAKIDTYDNIDILKDAVCNAWFTDNYLPVIQGKRLFKIRAIECIVAAGSFEQHVVFRNNDLPGIMMCSAALRLLKWYAIAPGKRTVILTGNDDGYRVALELLDHGLTVAAIIDMRNELEDESLYDAVRTRVVPVFRGSTVYEALATNGNKHIRAVDIRRITNRGQVAEDSKLVYCDTLCMSAGYMPTYQLLCQAGAKLTYLDDAAAFSISDLPEHLHIAGSVNGIHDLDAVVADGQRAAKHALCQLGKNDEAPTPIHCNQRVNFEWPIFPHPEGKEFVDYDEDLHIRDIINATRMGYRDVQLVKRFSTVGMGPSQGRHSALPTARLVAQATERSVTETGVTTARPPFAPEKLAHLAGRRFDPYRRTAMHQRHLQLGAQMMPAGNWQRPAYYGAPEQRTANIRREAKAVRQNVGLIDVSTLGGIEVRGPDAVEMMNRIYTGRFTQLPVGKTRYGIVASEHGVVIDDGVVCRLADEHFYTTATTSGVDRIYREMTKWNAQWRLDVDIYNVTSTFAAVNLAGPLSRKVLSKLVDTVDLSAEAFPYLGYREGKVAGIPARLLRVGFVGELGYEIHVPRGFGEALWDALMDAGKAFNICPFGVEAQRLLRLEKGHIIVSQDTDGMSHPGELDLGWAINHKKPFYVGCRSVDIMMSQPLTRKLVGFTLPADSPQPKEGHLVLNGLDVAGSVTSCEFSETLGSIIGLAYAAPESATPGSQIIIRVDNGDPVEAKVVPLPFYDSAGRRQEVEL